MTPRPENHERLGQAVRRRQQRRERWQREGERSLGQNLAMIGALGWTIVVPTLFGIFAGRWLDRTFHSGIFWTLGLAYFAALKRSVALFVGRKGWFGLLALTLGRIGAAAGFLFVAAKLGAAPLLAAFIGFLTTRVLALRAERRGG